MQTHQFRPNVTLIMDAEMVPAANMSYEFFVGGPSPMGDEATPWSHTIPTNMPWYQHNSPFPHVVNQWPTESEACKRRQFLIKRKGPTLDGETLPNKQFISEEVMAARMNELHISKRSSVATPMSCAAVTDTCNEPAAMQVGDVSSWNSSPNSGSQSTTLPSKQDTMIVLAPEIANIEEEPILPRSILERLQKPSMEVVLWKPPGGLVDHLIRSTLSKTASETRKDEEYQKRSLRISVEENQIFKSMQPKMSTSDASKICDADEEMTL